MKMRSYIKKKEERTRIEAEFCEISKPVSFYFRQTKRFLLALLALLAISLPFLLSLNDDKIDMVELSEESLMRMSSAPVAATGSSPKGTINIPAGTVKINPFVPYRNIEVVDSAKGLDVPAYVLVEPPETANTGSDAARVMDTIVSGILYDKYSPSAIINIEGSDYLVKKGDVVNNYQVLYIAQDSVTVKLGENTYKAGIGEILTEGTLNHNDVSNLNNKFGGAR